MSDNFTVIAGDGLPRTMRFVELAGSIYSQVIVAGENVRVFDGVQSLVLTGSAQALTVPSGATHCLIYAEGATSADYARYWQTGATPTSGAGKKLKDHEEIACASPANFKGINGSGTTTLRIEYYHYA
jgi:hypothetical protein